MPGRDVTAISQPLTADGGSDGYITVTTNVGFFPGVIGYLAATGHTSVEVIVTDLQGTTRIGVRKTSQLGYGRSDMSAFTVAAGWALFIDAQFNYLAPDRGEPENGTVSLDSNGMASWTSITGSALTVTAGGGDGDGIDALGNGIGSGGTFTGGNTSGNGIDGTGGAPNGNGVSGTGTGTGSGVVGIGGGSSGIGGNFIGGSTNGVGVLGTGSGTGAGVSGLGGGSNGHGVIGTGSGSGDGVRGTAGVSNGHGVSGIGGGAGAGINGIGGSSSGPGVLGTGGATNGVGVSGIGMGSGVGVQGVGGATDGYGGQFQGAGNGHGVFTQGGGTGAGIVGFGGGTSGAGLAGFGGAPNGLGLFGQGNGTGAGVQATGGSASGAGGSFSGGGPNGAGVVCSGVGSGPAIEIGNGFSRYTSSNPASSTGFSNTMTPANIPKAWGSITTNGSGGATLNAGFNITSVAISGSDILVTFATAMGSSTYVVNGNGQSSAVAQILPNTLATGTFKLSALSGTGTSTNLSTTAATIMFSVFALQ